MIKRWLREGTPRQRITELEGRVAQLTEERDAAQKECKRLSDYSIELLNARVRFEHEAIGLKLQLEEERTLRMEVIEHRNSLQARLNEAIAPKPKRASRAKPQEKEG